MTYLLLQTFLLLLSAYFAGAMTACLIKRALMNRSAETAAVIARTSPAAYVEQPVENIPLIKPREIDPVQPRIEVLPRPARVGMPVSEKIDYSRFERALTGPEFNEGMPRKMIVEIRPAVLKPVTGPAQPFKKPVPKVETPKVEVPKAEPVKPDVAKVGNAPLQPIKVDAPKSEPAKPVAATPTTPTTKPDAALSEPVKAGPSKAELAAAQAAASIQATNKAAAAAQTSDKPKSEASPASSAPASSSGMMSGIAGASAAAAAAVAAARAAAAAVVPRTAPPTPQQNKPVVEVKPAEPAKPTVQPSPPASASATPANPRPVATPAPAPVPVPANAKPAETKPAEIQASAKPAQPQPQPQSQPAPQKSVAASPAASQPNPTPTPQVAPPVSPTTGGDDLLRIRAIDADTARRLNGIGVGTFEQIAHWTPADVNRVNQALGLTGRVDREQWIEQAQILAMGGETYYSRNRTALTPKPAAPVQTTPATRPPAPSPAATPASAQAPRVAQGAPQNPQSSAPQPQATAVQAASVQTAKPAATTQPAAPAAGSATSTPAPAPSTAASTLQGRSVAEMATAAAAAIAAASASVTRGIRPIEPISPLVRANPNIVLPAKLSDALKDNESKAPVAQTQVASPAKATPGGKTDDLKRIRGVGVLIEKRLNALGITNYAQVADWNSGDVDRISQTLEFKGRIERESWIEQARILSSGGHTEFSRRVDRGDVETSRDDG